MATLNRVKVDRNRLIKTLKEKQKSEKVKIDRVVEKELETWKKELTTVCERNLKHVQAGRFDKVSALPHKPYKRRYPDYSNTIAMLEMSIDETVTLTAGEVERLGM